MKKAVLILGTLILLLAAVSPAQAAIATTVNSLDDSDDGSCQSLPGDCTLREAINAGASVIQFSLSGTILLTSALPALSHGVTISGTTAGITIDGRGAFQIFNITSGFSVILRQLTLTNGYATSGGAISNNGTLTLDRCTLTLNEASIMGGAIENNGTLIIDLSTLSNNMAVGGGAIDNNGPNGTLTISRSIISGNDATVGAGLYNKGVIATIDESTLAENTASQGGGGILNEAPLTITNSTFFNNSAATVGGAISQGSGDPTQITNSTFVSNQAPNGAVFITRVGWGVHCTHCTIYSNHATSVGGSALHPDSGKIYLRNSIVGNTTLGGQNCLHASQIENEGNNLEDDDSCAFYSNNGSHQNVTNLNLGVLADNGGLTQTLALASSSAAVNGVTYLPTDCGTGLLARDQRGMRRPLGGSGAGQCDIGAFEFPARLFLPLLFK